MAAKVETGKINVQTDNIFPIIKKFLYSDQDIFIRELVSNATDATTKVKKLASMGKLEQDLGTLQIDLAIDKEAKTLTISDKGIGMTSDEVKKYINQIALSGAEEFVEKFKEVDNKEIIGHFGLGFYSAFMVSDKVEIITKSYQNDEAVKWSCDGSPSFSLEASERAHRGTDIILHLNEESQEYLQEHKINEVLNRYCKFLPFPIYFGEEEIPQDKNEGEEDKEQPKEMRPRLVNNSSPAWTKSPADLKKEDYINFYNELYPMQEAPLFWIHLKTDFPFNLSGILYFPRVKNNFEIQKNRIQLYCNQVFVTDQVEEIVPEFLMLLQGVIDSPDIPLNVSRSYLQGDSNVKKITRHITKKTADKLGEIFKKERDEYEGYWKDIEVFVKYGMLSDEKFYEKAKDFCLFKTTDEAYFTIADYKSKIETNQKDKNDQLIVLYSNDVQAQHGYITRAKDAGYTVLDLSSPIEGHFINFMESKEDKMRFVRVDADTVDKLIQKDETVESVLSKEEQEKLTELFKTAVAEQAIEVQAKALSPNDLPVQLTKPEFNRRMKEMAEMGGSYSFMGNMPDQLNLIVNTNHPMANKILKSKGKKEEYVRQLCDLALLEQNMLKGNKLTDFIKRSVDVLAN